MLRYLVALAAIATLGVGGAVVTGGPVTGSSLKNVKDIDGGVNVNGSVCFGDAGCQNTPAMTVVPGQFPIVAACGQQCGEGSKSIAAYLPTCSSSYIGQSYLVNRRNGYTDNGNFYGANWWGAVLCTCIYDGVSSVWYWVGLNFSSGSWGFENCGNDICPRAC